MAFHGKIALITGGASGIGRTHALQLATKGAKVVIVDVDEKGLTDLSSGSENIIPIPCDVTSLDDIQNIIEKIETDIGNIDRLIHCAAVMPGGLLAETQTEEINRIMNINHQGMVNTVQSVLPYFLERNRGDIIVYGSVAGIVVTHRFGAYGASKSATNYYMQVLMSENAYSDIRFLLVCPPAVDTPLINQAKNEGPVFLRDIQKTRKNLLSPESVVRKVERTLDKGKQICYPGPAKWVQFLYPLFPRLINHLVNQNNGKLDVA